MELYLRPGQDEPSPDDDNDIVDLDRPLLIPLRLPVALLSNLSSKSHLEISHRNNYDAGSGKPRTSRETTAIVGGDNDDAMTITITQNPNSGKRQEGDVEMHSMGALGHHQKRTDWYHKSADHNMLPGEISQNNELQYIGTTKKHYCQSTNKSSKMTATTNNKLKEIGERTRRLLEEERKKRKEIVRLDDDEQCILPLPDKEAPPTSFATTQSTPNSNMQPSSLAAEKKMMKRSGATTARKRKRREVAANIDGWMPNVDDLLTLPTSNSVFLKKGDADQQQSSIVRLHGLPMGVKPEHIRKFFHGLNPGLIFVLPTFPNCIHGWDAAAAAAGHDGNNQQCIVKRHSNTFRVFVKFTSYPVANAAIERTGESIEFDEEWQNEGASLVGEAVRAKKMVGASVSMSPVSKRDASFMQKHMVSFCTYYILCCLAYAHGVLMFLILFVLCIDDQAIHTQKGEAIMTTARRLEKQIGTVVTQLIWEMAMKKMNLSHRIRGIGDAATDPECSVPTNESQYQTLAKLYNQLIDTHEQLELENGIIFTHAFDPTIDDSAHRITQSVSNWLLDRVSTIGRLLNESRQWLNLGMHN